jgi:type IV pilus assembly protein PilV
MTGYRVTGFSMLETMVAAMVFAFGAIGATGMQILATEANHEAMYRTRAVYLATDLIERLRDNPEGLETYDSSADNLWRIVGSHSISKEPEPDCVSTSCTPQQLATHDLWAWEQVLDGKDVYREGVSATGGLPSPTGCIRLPRRRSGRTGNRMVWPTQHVECNLSHELHGSGSLWQSR